MGAPGEIRQYRSILVAHQDALVGLQNTMQRIQSLSTLLHRIATLFGSFAPQNRGCTNGPFKNNDPSPHDVRTQYSTKPLIYREALGAPVEVRQERGILLAHEDALVGLVGRPGRLELLLPSELHLRTVRDRIRRGTSVNTTEKRTELPLTMNKFSEN